MRCHEIRLKETHDFSRGSMSNMAIDANKLLSFRAASEVAILVSPRIVSPVIFQDFLPVLRVSPHPFGMPLLARIGILHTVLLAAVLAVRVKTVPPCLVAVELRLRKCPPAVSAPFHRQLFRQTVPVCLRTSSHR